MKIAYFSPLSPDPTGISDFSEELLPELKKYMDIDVFCRVSPNKTLASQFSVFTFDKLLSSDKLPDTYDLMVYHMGNAHCYHKGVADCFFKYPGILELHDLSLHHFLALETYSKGDYNGYIQKMQYCHGALGKKVAEDFLNGKIRAPWETDSDRFPVNKYFVDKAKAVIVHSDMAKQTIKGIRSDVPIVNIPLHCIEYPEDPVAYQAECRRELGLNSRTLIMGSFGFASSAKRIVQILEALGRIKSKRNTDFHYFIVGKPEDSRIMSKIEEFNLKSEVTITGFVTLDKFKLYMGACDFCFNLRYPTQGESSASLHRMLGMGKVAVVTDIGAFQEYPDEFTPKVSYKENEVDDIFRTICGFVDNRQGLAEQGRKALEYAKQNYSLERNAKRYADFFKSIIDETWKEEWLDSLVDRLMELDFVEDNYITDFSKYCRL